MASGNDDQRILEEAAQWFERVRHGSEADRRAFRAWLEARPEHVAAMDLVERVARRAPAAARAAGLHVAAPPRPAFTLPRWSWPALGTALAGICAVVAWTHGTHDQRIVAPGDRMTVASLADGSRVWLTAGSAVSVHVTPIARTAVLTGEASFDVRHGWRPFTVSAGRVQVVDRGTLFSVARQGDRVTVILAHGAVDINDRKSGTTIATPRPGQQVVIDRASAVVSSVDADGALAWRTGRIVASDLPFGTVAARFAQLGGARIRVATPAIASLRVYGTYRAGDAEPFLRAMQALHPIRWRRTKDGYEVSGR